MAHCSVPGLTVLTLALPASSPPQALKASAQQLVVAANVISRREVVIRTRPFVKTSRTGGLTRYRSARAIDRSGRRRELDAGADRPRRGGRRSAGTDVGP